MKCKMQWTQWMRWLNALNGRVAHKQLASDTNRFRDGITPNGQMSLFTVIVSIESIFSFFFSVSTLRRSRAASRRSQGMLCRDICDRHVHADPHPLAFTHSYCMSFKRFDFLNSEFAWKWFTHTRSACRVHVIYMKEPTRNGMRANSCSSASCKKPKQINSRADRRRAQITGKTN